MRAVVLVIIWFCLLFSTSSAGSSRNLLEKFKHSLRAGDQFVTDINSWTLDDEDFRCILFNGSFGILDEDELCDGNITCLDAADESEQICHALERCPPGKIRCPLERVCLKSEQLCDGVSDCTKDAWDERETAGCLIAIQSNAAQLECPDGMFVCAANVKCLGKDALCNYKWDCDDGSDESPSMCPDGRTCPEGTFHCYKTEPDEKSFFHHCVTVQEVCNQIGDCPNSEDEMPDLSQCTIEDLLNQKADNNQPISRKHHRHLNKKGGEHDQHHHGHKNDTEHVISTASHQPHDDHTHAPDDAKEHQHSDKNKEKHGKQTTVPSQQRQAMMETAAIQSPERKNLAGSPNSDSQMFLILAGFALTFVFL